MLLMVIASVAHGQTCSELKAEIARLQQSLATAQRGLANCHNILGSCTPGQVSSFQMAVDTAEQEILADEALLRQKCGPPPAPTTDHVSLQGIEVVQSIQDLANSVTLIAGKPTWVRVYFDKASGTRELTATLKASRGGTTITLNPSRPSPILNASILVDSSENISVRRKTWTKSLNFAVPAAMISSGTTLFTVGAITDASPAHKTIICDNCSSYAQVSFYNTPPLLIRAIGVTYPFSATPAAAPVTVIPSAADFTLLKSWLGRAYPVAQVTFSQTTTPSNNTSGVVQNGANVTGTFTCTQTNTQIFFIRANDIDAGADQLTHYIGLVSNQGFFMRGCASRPADATTILMASGPSGSPASPSNVPVNAAGDSDSSFADWYGGHELGHTFGRDHAGFCNGNGNPANGPVDPSFPNPNGQISDASPTSFAGLDVGDKASIIPISVLWGSSTFDIMTYCNQPNWPSAYTYEAIRHFLLVADPDFDQNAQGGASAPGSPLLTGRLVQVVATVNLTKRTGSIDYVTPVTRALPSIGPASGVALVARDAAGQELYRQSVPLAEMVDRPAGEDHVAVVAAAIPFRPDMGRIELVLDGAVLAKFDNPRQTPDPARNVRITSSAGGGRRLTWTAAPASAGRVTYVVQVSTDGQAWETIAAGFIDPALTLSAEQARMRMARIIISNGFRKSAPVTIRLTPAQAPATRRPHQ
jgi:hypothetical protein